MKTNYLLALCFIALSLNSFAQDGLPENPEPGKCYAKCVTPDEFDEETERVLIKPEYKKLEIVPAEYKTVTETIEIKPASVKYTYVPAKYETAYDTVWVKPDYNKLAIEPSEFSDDVTPVEIKSKIGRWVAGAKDPDCPSIDPDDCRILYYTEDPAIIKDVPIEKLAKAETTNSTKITGKYILVKKEVEVSPAKYEETKIPAVTKEVSKEVLVKDETTKEITIPAEYTEVTKVKLVKAGGLTVWREVPCTLPSSYISLPINYESGSAILTPTAKRLIDDKLLPVMANNKTSIVEIGSHTDSRGSSSSNQQLSEKRAKSVVEYLISKGIDKKRLLAVGYGETRLTNKCSDGIECSNSQHASNRRTEFKIY